MRFHIFLFTAILFAGSAHAAIVSKNVEYKDGETKLTGILVYDDEAQSPQPGLVIYPEWWGHNEYVKNRAQEFASLGYTAFVADMYGEGKVTNDPKVATELTKPFQADRNLMRTRAKAALDALRAQENVEKDNIILTGFCFGGTNALEVARSGEDVKGVAAFHAGLDFPDAVKKDSVKAHVLVMNGANDPFVPLAADEKFITEMQAANADAELDLYAHAKHAFTNPDADKAGIEGVAYNEKAEKRAIARMKAFLKEVFGK
jgi:dienelactone hydrolase